MARGGFCGMPPNHLGRCRTPDGVAKAYARNIARHKRVVDERHLWLDEYKLARGCVDCGYRKAAVALDFDHRDPELKVANIAAMLWKNITLIEAEIAKCDIRCACCHRIKTHELDESRNRRRPGPDIMSRPGLDRD
jgi:hypothetical protein